MATKLSHNSAYGLLLLPIAYVLTSVIEPATDTLCRKYAGAVPASYGLFTWSIPLSPKGQSATFQVKVSNDFMVSLVPDLILPPPTPWNTKYKFGVGMYSNTQGRMDYTGTGYNNLKVLDANRPVALWFSWSGGLIALGNGSTVGMNTLMSFIDPSPTQVNYLLIGGYNAVGTVDINYCFGSIYDWKLPIDPPTTTTTIMTALDCGRTCEQDPRCQGYALVHDAPLVGSIACAIYYAISRLQYDSEHVTYLYGNGT